MPTLKNLTPSIRCNLSCGATTKHTTTHNNTRFHALPTHPAAPPLLHTKQVVIIHEGPQGTEHLGFMVDNTFECFQIEPGCTVNVGDLHLAREAHVQGRPGPGHGECVDEAPHFHGIVCERDDCGDRLVPRTKTKSMNAQKCGSTKLVKLERVEPSW